MKENLEHIHKVILEMTTIKYNTAAFKSLKQSKIGNKNPY